MKKPSSRQCGEVGRTHTSAIDAAFAVEQDARWW